MRLRRTYVWAFDIAIRRRPLRRCSRPVLQDGAPLVEALNGPFELKRGALRLVS